MLDHINDSFSGESVESTNNSAIDNSNTTAIYSVNLLSFSKMLAKITVENHALIEKLLKDYLSIDAKNSINAILVHQELFNNISDAIKLYNNSIMANLLENEVLNNNNTQLMQDYIDTTNSLVNRLQILMNYQDQQLSLNNQLLDPDLSPEEKDRIMSQLSVLNQDIFDIQQNIETLNNKLDDIQSKLAENDSNLGELLLEYNGLITTLKNLFVINNDKKNTIIEEQHRSSFLALKNEIPELLQHVLDDINNEIESESLMHYIAEQNKQIKDSIKKRQKKELDDNIKNQELIKQIKKLITMIFALISLIIQLLNFVVPNRSIIIK